MIGAKAVGMSDFVAIAAFYLVAVNAITFAVYGLDKSQAYHHGPRVPERTLLLLGLAGGSPAGFAAQRYFRHKTRKQSFQLAFWLLAAIQAGALIAVVLTA